MPIFCKERPSPNFNERPAGRAVDILLLHYTGMASAEEAAARLCDPAAKVSSHYMVDEDGAITRMVPEHLRAWHAGAGNWAGDTDINGCSIGIEIANGGHDFGCPPYPDAQMDAVEALCLDILSRHRIPPRRVLGHSDIAPARKADPGEWFDWARLARAGVGVWLEPEPVIEGPVLQNGDRGDTVAELQYLLADYGYGLEVLGRYDDATEAVVTAFQRHFRPQKVDGVADISTVATLRRLLEAVKSLA
ncbi:N-acetylmuramoyl-L-alanine amidase [Parvibaculum sp.]|uniref:peptidoglycan recognition protein family protein n=1 Tax=Parvibaculum sp. TaxID=2024848 RepID=UPI002731C5AD|nr:N-acetylmuramoyl-L-alanine amidase [Parvibaculum sp.]MDP1626963.1 N-acetylmuramoyl-L-alanine amidase [Parvibaculum sp.]MDP2151641.1 N-acetylmuramoyl-L-alanine amidase [Parvibaculum sp.]MDP3327590.1 N-acetylmuramoyl-L-alanine amidase [Parvibaculum sp.]